MLCMTYQQESAMKRAYMRECQNAQMNEDFKALLLNLPIPILLLSDKQVTLSNNETKKLLSLPNEAKDATVEERITEKLFRSCHYMEGIGEDIAPKLALDDETLRLDVFDCINISKES